MYEVKENGVLKAVESWNVVIPLHDNDGNIFEESLIDNILQEILLNYPGFTRTNSIGYWKDKEQTYIDKNYQVTIDTIPDSIDDSSKFFAELKTELQKQLKQEKIYITKQDAKQEFLSFDEFFDEIGIEVDSKNLKQEANNIVKKLVKNFDFVIQRLGYQTTFIKRDKAHNKIIWERKICGILIKSEFDDILPEDLIIVAADQIKELGDAFFGEKPFAIIGSYEFLSYILQKNRKRKLIEADINVLQNIDEIPFISQQGEPLSNKQFIEDFTMSIFTNWLILRDEGFQPLDININVGSDGSMQHGINDKGSILLRCPAIIPNATIQKEIIRCVSIVINQYENNNLDSIAILQTKAKNIYTFKRALVHYTLKNN